MSTPAVVFCAALACVSKKSIAIPRMIRLMFRHSQVETLAVKAFSAGERRLENLPL
jgi:hypothetical protein